MAGQLKCIITSDNLRCIFQDLALGKMIGTAKVWNGLYYFESSTPQTLITSSTTTTMMPNEIMLCYSRLGHPSLSYMKVLFPNMNKEVIADFHCDTCYLAKQVRSS